MNNNILKIISQVISLYLCYLVFYFIYYSIFIVGLFNSIILLLLILIVPLLLSFPLTKEKHYNVYIGFSLFSFISLLAMSVIFYIGGPTSYVYMYIALKISFLNFILFLLCLIQGKKDYNISLKKILKSKYGK